MDQTINVAHSMHTNPGVYALLLGSGVSRSAGIPTGWEVTIDLIKRLAVMDGQSETEDLEAWYRTKYSEEPGYSAILARLSKTSPERRAILQGFFEPTDDEKDDGLKLPTLAHRSIARLVSQGFIRVILTTNFDRLMETALSDEGVAPVVISTADALSGAAPLTHQKCVIVKLHGDYLDDRIKNTEDELSVYSDPLNAYLDRILDEFGLIIAGWSGDWDPALRSALERCVTRRYATYWTARGKVSKSVQKLVDLRGANLVSVNDADGFFDEIAEKVAALQELGTADRKSNTVKLALLKKYVADPVHRVRLADLLSEERTAIIALHQADTGCQSSEKFEDTMRHRFRAYDAACSTLSEMMFHAARWGERTHDEIILQTIASLIPPSQRSGITGLLDLMIYPGMQVFYHAVAGAIMGRNFALLKRLMKHQFNFKGHARTSLPELTTAYCISLDTQKMLCENRQYFPFSEHLLKIMEPLLTQNGVDAEQFYIRLETLLAMIVLDQNEDPAVDAWLPYGIFAWNHEDRRRNPILEEAQLHGDDWSPYKAGFFKGGFDRLEAVHAALEEKLTKSSNRWW